MSSEERRHVDEGYAVLAADADGVYRVVNMPRKVEYVFVACEDIIHICALLAYRALRPLSCDRALKREMAEYKGGLAACVRLFEIDHWRVAVP